MTRLWVWAPRAESVDAVIDGARLPMERAGEDFVLEVDSDVVDYAFSVDGGYPRPDPRSNHQPEGVHGPSRTVDHSAFSWSSRAPGTRPLRDWVVYELHVGTFSPEGTFAGVVDKLDHLVDLDIDAIELMPVAEFPGARGWGYDGVDLYAPHHAHGGPDELKRLVDACHQRGLATILDVVYNHLGPSGNYLAEFGPYFTDRYVTPWGRAINLDDAGSDPVRRFIVDNALHWLEEYHFDALRLDAVHAIVDTSATHILEQLAREVAALSERTGRDLYLIAESDLNDPRLVRGWDEGGYGLDAQWNDDFHHALHALLTGERDGYYADFGDIAHLERALTRTFVYAGDHSRARRRTHGRPPDGVPKARFFAYLQNHDQIGNRARGERTSQLLEPAALKLGAALALLSPYIPMLFQGEEWAASTPFQYFTDHEDRDLGRAVSEGRKREFAAFGWDPDEVPDPQDPATFERSRLNWDELDDGLHKEMLDWHRQLISLRKQHLTPGQDVPVSVQGSTLTMVNGRITARADFAGPSIEVAVDGEVFLQAP